MSTEAEAPPVMRPTRVLFTVGVNKNRANRLIDSGVETRGYQKTPERPSGKQVFGEEGKESCTLSGLFMDLQLEGYVCEEVYLFQRPQDKRLYRLAVSMRYCGERPAPFNLAAVCQDFIEGTTWKHVHVWANPIDDKREVVHCVEVAKSQPSTNAAVSLVFELGKWS